MGLLPSARAAFQTSTTPYGSSQSRGHQLYHDTACRIREYALRLSGKLEYHPRCSIFTCPSHSLRPNPDQYVIPVSDNQLHSQPKVRGPTLWRRAVLPYMTPGLTKVNVDRGQGNTVARGWSLPEPSPVFVIRQMPRAGSTPTDLLTTHVGGRLRYSDVMLP